MRLLLDTHILLWMLGSPQRLPPVVREAVCASANDLLVSAASVWEMGIKCALGRLDFPLERTDALLREAGIEPLAISIEHAVAAAGLPRHHDDPFDRMLVAQAQVEGLALVTEDAMMRRYDVRIF